MSVRRIHCVVTLAAVFSSYSLSVHAEEYKLPPEVTPKLRAACESDVRRLCIGTNPSVAKVKLCVASKFFQLGKRCQIQLALAGFKR